MSYLVLFEHKGRSRHIQHRWISSFAVCFPDLVNPLSNRRCLCSCALSNVVDARKKKTKNGLLNDRLCSIEAPPKTGASGLCPRAPCLLKQFGSFSSSVAVSLISSRQAVWRGLKAFAERSPGLINTHFLLEALAQTHQRLWAIRWWHSPLP